MEPMSAAETETEAVIETEIAPVQPEADLAVPEAEPSEDFAWEASEYLHHDKQPGWFFILGGVTLALVVAAVLTQQWFSIPVVILIGVSILVYGVKQPRVLRYALTEDGIEIGPKLYPYKNFRSFAVIQDVAWHTIDLEPTQRFMPRLTILFDDEHFPDIVSLLSEQLPEVHRTPDWVERLARYLKF